MSIINTSPVGIEIQLLTLAYKNMLPMLLVNLGSALGAAIVLTNNGLPDAWYWLFVVFLLTSIRLWIWFRFCVDNKNQRILDVNAYQYWRRLYAVGLYLAACLWVSIFCISIGSTHQEGKYTLSIILSALAGGATGIIAPLQIEGRIYIILLLLPTSVALGVISSVDLILALLGLIFLIVMVISHNNNHKLVRQSFMLQRENTELIADLQDLNSSLEIRVVTRTEELKRIAHRDALTGLPNRRALLEWMGSTLSPDNEGEAAVLFLDLDRFKQINDVLGHDVGDQVLQAIAFRFREMLPADAILGRWGGDEFLLITRQQPGVRKYAEDLARQLIEVAIAPFEMTGEKLGLGLSVGVAYYPTDANNYKDVIQAADLSVAEVKRIGRGQVLSYSDTYAETQRRRFDLSRSLIDALFSGQISLVYQPIVDVQTGQVAALEALARWNHPVLGEINPDEFIRLAEDTDRIVALGDWVLRNACIEAMSWTNPLLPKIAVNVSIKQLLSDNFALRVTKILHQIEMPLDRLQLEVTESIFNEENLDTMLATVQNLRQLDIEIHIDDFGTGYSSLSRLHQFPVNTIKIDRSFIAQIDRQGSVIVESAVMIAKRMNFNVIAEGVETAAQAKVLAAMGVNYLQGFYLARPQPIARLDAFATDWLPGGFATKDL